MAPPKAIQSCQACRRLKRRCSKDLPICSLCIRLNKACEYPGIQSPDSNVLGDVVNRLRNLEEHLDKRHSSQDTIRGTKPSLPAAFFLDNGSFTALGPNSLSWGLDNSLHQAASALLGLDRTELCAKYFLAIQPWFPFLSKKRLLNGPKSPSTDVDGCEPLLTLCFGLLTEELTDSSTQNCRASPLYTLIKAIVSAAGNSGCISLRLVQSLVLLSLYEFGHALYPTAHLTLGQAARMGTVMGLQSKSKASQLFSPPNSWTLREEQRRTWWAILILDRFANIGVTGLPLCALDPTSTDLLPVNDTAWETGQVVANEPLYTTEFCCVAMVSPLARTCQAAHMLGKTIQHDAVAEDSTHVLSEALQIHRALTSLCNTLELKEELRSNISALSLCCSALFLLYDRYQANESDRLVRLPAETELQHLTLDSIRAIASITAPKIARCTQAIQEESNISISPLVGPCLYRAANVCAWLIREDHDLKMYDALGAIVGGLQGLRKRWPVAGQYLKLLDESGVLQFINPAVSSLAIYSN